MVEETCRRHAGGPATHHVKCKSTRDLHLCHGAAVDVHDEIHQPDGQTV